MPYDLPNWLASKIMPEPNSGCWLWLASVDAANYGMVRVGRHPNFRDHAPAHRFIYEFYNGPVSENLVIDHLCRNTFCVNPNHLEPVTEQENILRGTGSSAKNARKQFCDNGHSLHDAYFVSGGRKCRICQLANMKRYYTRKHAR